MIVEAVRFKSGLTDNEVLETYQARAPRYRSLPNLRQKYYLRYSRPGEHGAVYLWESEAAMRQFHESELGKTISKAYQVQGSPDIQTADLVMMLRHDEETVS